MPSHRLEVRVDAETRQWLQQLSQETGRSQAEITRAAIAKAQLELNNNKTPIA